MPYGRATPEPGTTQTSGATCAALSTGASGRRVYHHGFVSAASRLPQFQTSRNPLGPSTTKGTQMMTAQVAMVTAHHGMSMDDMPTTMSKA
jgi:hypothetical protein